jgi:hypothetical protein
MRALVVVTLKTPDPVAASAFGALTRRLGHEGRLVALDRAILYDLEVDDSQSSHLVPLLEHTTLLANPNKEVATLVTDPAGLLLSGPAILIWDREGPAGAALTERIRRDHAELGTLVVRRAVLWTARFAPGVPDPEAAARALADGSTRTSGLLANPHADAFVVLTGCVPPGVLHHAGAVG